jgi:hypothetical protein
MGPDKVSPIRPAAVIKTSRIARDRRIGSNDRIPGGVTDLPTGTRLRRAFDVSKRFVSEEWQPSDDIRQGNERCAKVTGHVGQAAHGSTLALSAGL